jgi:uncharacterized protein (UPF0335 family)
VVVKGITEKAKSHGFEPTGVTTLVNLRTQEENNKKKTKRN